MTSSSLLLRDATGIGYVQTLILICTLALGGIAGVRALRSRVDARSECAGQQIATLSLGVGPCGQGGSPPAQVTVPLAAPIVADRGESENTGDGDRGDEERGRGHRDLDPDDGDDDDGGDDGLSERERAARDLQPDRYDDVPGTAEERMNTATPPPPGDDQCSFSFDHVAGLYDFSYACYAHDLCWQNGSIGGSDMTIGACNDEFRRRMRDHCDRRNTGFGSGFRENRCFDAADAYFGAVSAAGAAKTIHDCPVLSATLGPAAAMYLCHPRI